MRYYFNKLRWKISTANNFIEFIHYIKRWFRKSLAQKRFNSDIKFRYHIIVS